MDCPVRIPGGQTTSNTSICCEAIHVRRDGASAASPAMNFHVVLPLLAAGLSSGCLEKIAADARRSSVLSGQHEYPSRLPRPVLFR